MKGNYKGLRTLLFLSFVVFFILFSISFFISCKKKSTILPDSEISLKNQVSNKDSNSFWVDELEGDILTKDISSNQYMSNNVSVTTDLLNLLNNLKPAAYPAVNEMGSLDLSNTDEKLVRFARKDANCVKNNPSKDLGSLFHSDYVFNYVLFQEDLRSNWKKNFNTKYPDKDLFLKYYIFAPEESFDLLQIPVRFINRNGFVDIKLVIGNNEKEYKIKEIDIIKWGMTNGE